MSSLVLQSPLVLPEHGGQRVQVVVREEDGRTDVSVYSQRAEASPETALDAACERRGLPLGLARRRHGSIWRRCARAAASVSRWRKPTRRLRRRGWTMARVPEACKSLWRGPSEAIAEVTLAEEVEGAERYGIHPALLDAAFQSLYGIARMAPLHLPFAMEKVTVHASGATAAAATCAAREEEADGASGEGFAADVTLTDAQGHVLVEVVGLRVRPPRKKLLPRAWKACERALSAGLVASPAPAGVGDFGSVGRGRARQRTRRRTRSSNELRLAGAASIASPCQRLAAALPAEHVVCLWRGARAEKTARRRRIRWRAQGLSMVQLLARQELAPRLWWVTRGAVTVTAEEPADVGQASLWGLGRTVMQEHPELACTLIDVEDDGVRRRRSYASCARRTRNGRSSGAAASVASRD